MSVRFVLWLGRSLIGDIEKVVDRKILALERKIFELEQEIEGVKARVNLLENKPQRDEDEKALAYLKKRICCARRRIFCARRGLVSRSATNSLAKRHVSYFMFLLSFPARGELVSGFKQLSLCTRREMSAEPGQVTLVFQDFKDRAGVVLRSGWRLFARCKEDDSGAHARVGAEHAGLFLCL
jgi:cell division protein FtsB